MRLSFTVLLMLCTGICSVLACIAQGNRLLDTGIISLDLHSYKNMPASAIAQLKTLLKDKRVVMLGEATHGDGNVQELKTMMVKFLHEELGFSMLAFESGLYDVYKANKDIQAAHSFKEAISKSIFSVWVNSQQCQELWQYLERSNAALALAGFDSQISGEYGRNMIADLEDVWEEWKMRTEPDFDLLEAVIHEMADHFSFPAKYSFHKFKEEVNKIIRVLDEVTVRDPNAAFWKQAMLSVLALANDYYYHNPSAKNESTFKASDSNPRDRQMALNLLFLLKQYPTAKFICWGATTHFMNNPDVLHDNELSSYVPMGKLLKEALGDKVCIIGATAGGGSYGIFGKDPVRLQPVKNSLEEKMADEKRSWSMISLKQFSFAVFKSYVIEHKPLTGKWQDVLDGMLYVPQLSPSVFYTPAPERKTEPVVQNASTVFPDTKPAGKLIGKVMDKTTSLPVQFASIRLGTVTLISNNAGLFEWPLGLSTDSIEISCIGYKSMVQNAPTTTGRDTMCFLLTQDSAVLPVAVVRLPERDPVLVMKKVIDHRKTNLPTKDFTLSMYVHETLLEKRDTIRDVEYITDIYSQKGYDKDFSIRAGLSELRWNKKLSDSIFLKTGSILNVANTAYLKAFSRIDYLYDLPLFTSKSKLKHYRLTLDSVTILNDERVYVINFVSKQKREKYTFSFNTAGFYGKVYINTNDYAVLKYNITVETDTSLYNSDARKYFSRKTFENDKYFWSLLKSGDVVNKSVIYNKQDGVYIPVYASLTNRQAGIAQLSQMPVSYFGSAEYYLYNFKWGSAETPANVETNLFKFKKTNNPAFWNTLIKPLANAY